MTPVVISIAALLAVLVVGTVASLMSPVEPDEHRSLRRHAARQRHLAARQRPCPTLRSGPNPALLPPVIVHVGFTG